jgi:hypothetical protein
MCKEDGELFAILKMAEVRECPQTTINVASYYCVLILLRELGAILKMAKVQVSSDNYVSSYYCVLILLRELVAIFKMAEHD